MATSTFTAFGGTTRVARGPLEEILGALLAWTAAGRAELLVFDDASGQQVDLDLRGSLEEARARLAAHPYLVQQREQAAARSGPGRPKLGVVPREVTLLPRHWDWLAEQPGGASVTLRKLVEGAMRQDPDATRRRQAQDAAARFMSTMAGNLPGYEEALRAFYRHDLEGFAERIADWPTDLRDHALELVREALPLSQEASDELQA